VREDEIVVEVTGLAPGGDAVGRQVGGAAEGRVTFVAFAAPGERVRARVVREKKNVAWAELVAVERASPERVSPPCPLFGTCGGCQWQHVSASAQREAKRQIVERALGVAVEVRAVGPEYGYRERARLVAGGGVLGFRAWRSHAVVDVPRCPLLAPALEAELPSLRVLALPPGTEVSLQMGANGVGVRIEEPAASAGSGAHPKQLAGSPTVDVAEPGSPPLHIPPGAFAQVSREANGALVEEVLAAVGATPGRTLELYAGSGNFTRHLVTRASDVTASDGDREAMARGRAQVPQARWSERPDPPAVDTVVVDPPREGLDGPNLALALRGRRVVYVSCDPQTLARDAARLKAAGFRLTRAVALDLMPQTFHVEVVATFER
jgi:23S rRNA (uracil1939-C5)-methyltransferase